MTEAHDAAAAISRSSANTSECASIADNAQTATQQLAGQAAALGAQSMAAAIRQINDDITALASTLNNAGVSAEAALTHIEEYESP